MPLDAHTPHPFSRFVAILGRGKTKQRHLTLEESSEAMAMILAGDVLPEQLGAFLMLLRLKEESPEEIAGFVQATRATFELPDDPVAVDIDWSSYAGKRSHLPWFLLSVAVLVGSGHRVAMHGTEGHTAGRVYTRDLLPMLGFPVAGSLTEAADQVGETGFTYIPLEVLSPRLRELINLRPIFGLRSPVHTFSRMLNPFDAPVMMQGIFHRGFMDIHSGAAQILDQPSMAVFRGEGGEIERRPNKPVQVWTTHGQAGPHVETWPALIGDTYQPAAEDMSPQKMLAVWRGDVEDPYALASITGTLAVALRTMGRAENIETADALAAELWEHRDRRALPAP
ncbi:glycosyl transferase family protein [Tropicimonas sp. IMCC6043]|uniref:glycosyl transferase family protein n=1 Tax=Tropicimonas sp. IMCC6043 TaxID=2510645 RepID=UPI00101DBE35|nr:glycosyl transferase family protein [Tropicimonas sp. IMCC6043]RYH12236.1 glycosyl transferase family protein [Tropicimonas sp. IMCC6043]